MIRKKLFRGLGVATVILAAAACQGTDAGVDDVRDKHNSDSPAHLETLPAAEVVQADDDAIPRFVIGNLGRLATASHLEKTDFGAALSAIAPVFLADASELSLRRARTDERGDQHFRFSQTKNGLPVIGAELVLHARDGVIIAANGSARSDLPADEVPMIDVSEALRAARGSSETADVSVDGEAPLAYYAAGKRLALVYQVEVRGQLEDGTPVRDTVLVNAADGSIALRIPHIHTAKNRQVYTASNLPAIPGFPVLPGALVRSEGQTASRDTTVNVNYDWLGKTYDCYKNLFGRDSYNNAGAAIVSSVHYDTNYVNAFWDGTQLVFGDGDGVTSSSLAHSMDVTAHELTHAVTGSESNLTYSGESGGLNEAMSDIFGAVCEWYRDGQVVNGKTWIVGDEVWTPAIPGDGLRYMANPAQDGESLDFYDANAGSADVHLSSGIANLAFYLLSQGGTHPQGKSSVNVTGIGILKAARVFYKANVDILTANATFYDAKTATVQAATQLGLTQAEIDSVTRAWDAVNVFPPPPPPATALQNNVPLTNQSGGVDLKYYKLDVPAGATNLVFKTSGGTGGLIMDVQLGWPSSGQACVPTGSGTSLTCAVSNVQAGTYYVTLFGFPPYSGVTLKGSFTAPAATTADLVVNEIDYDTVGTDSAEYVEIYNPAGGAVSLSGCSLVLVNGANGDVYSTFDLSPAGSLAAGQYLVVGASTVAVPAGAKKINFATSTNVIQNDTEGVALVCGASVVDKLSYEGNVTAASIPGVGTVSLVEGTAFTTVDSNTLTRSLCRLPNGADTDNASVDWSACSNLTPGAPN